MSSAPVATDATLAPYAADFAARAASRAAEPAGLRTLREDANGRFLALGFPSMRQEAWRFTNVGPLARTPFVRATPAALAEADVEPWLFPDMAHLVIVDGVFAAALSNLDGIPAGVRFGSLAVAIANGDPAVAALGKHTKLDDAPFAALNTALFADGALVHLARNTVCARPLQVLFVSTLAGEPRVSYPRLLIVAEEHSSAVVVERYVVTPPDCPNWTKPPYGDHSNTPASNFGCATATNLGLMVADPRDLVIGRSLGPPRGDPALYGYSRYRVGKPRKPDTTGTSGSFSFSGFGGPDADTGY